MGCCCCSPASDTKAITATFITAAPDLIDVRDAYGRWCAAKILKRTQFRIRVHYIDFDECWDEWIDIPSEQNCIAEYGKFSCYPRIPVHFTYRVLQPQYVKILHEGLWYDGITSYSDGNQVRVQFYKDMFIPYERWYLPGANDIKFQNQHVVSTVTSNEVDVVLRCVADTLELKGLERKTEIRNWQFALGIPKYVKTSTLLSELINNQEQWKSIKLHPSVKTVFERFVALPPPPPYAGV